LQRVCALISAEFPEVCSGWQKVHDAAVEVLARGLWKANGDEETEMQKTQRKRSLLMKTNRK
jgi:hypothetical protein